MEDFPSSETSVSLRNMANLEKLYNFRVIDNGTM